MRTPASRNAHAGPQAHVHLGARTLSWRPLFVRFVHGLAGSGALTALVLAELDGTAARVIYMTRSRASSTCDPRRGNRMRTRRGGDVREGIGCVRDGFGDVRDGFGDVRAAAETYARRADTYATGTDAYAPRRMRMRRGGYLRCGFGSLEETTQLAAGGSIGLSKRRADAPGR
jgi:hypothetical protein